MGYARIRPELFADWSHMQVKLADLEGNELYWTPESEWVKAVCFDAMQSGLYVLTEDDDYYFTCHSIHLEYKDEPTTVAIREGQWDVKPTERGKRMAKHAGRYDQLRDIAESKEEAVVSLGQELDTWQLIARDLARDITRGHGKTNDAVDFAALAFARDVMSRLAVMPEMNIHPSELTR
jgi:hypothetical protein